MLEDDEEYDFNDEGDEGNYEEYYAEHFGEGYIQDHGEEFEEDWLAQEFDQYDDEDAILISTHDIETDLLNLSLEDKKGSVEDPLLVGPYRSGPVFLEKAQLEEYEAQTKPERDLDFLLREELTGNTSSIAIYRKQHMQAIIDSIQDKKKLFRYAYSLPENECSLKLEVKDQWGMAASVIKQIIRERSFQKADELLLKYKEDCKAVEALEEWCSLETSASGAQITKKLDEAKALMKLKVKNLATAIGYIFLANGRLIRSQYYLPGIKTKAVVERTVYVLSEDHHMVLLVKPSLVREKIYDIVYDEDFSGEEDMPFFTLDRLPRDFAFKWVTVTCRQMPSPRKYFEQCFLNPSDKIMHWLLREEPKSGYMAADVVIALGLRELPPYRATPERWQRNVAENVKESKDIKLVDNLVHLLEEASPTDAQSRRTQWEAEKGELSVGSNVTDDVAASRQPTQDPWDMTCSIEF